MTQGLADRRHPLTDDGFIQGHNDAAGLGGQLGQGGRLREALLAHGNGLAQSGLGVDAVDQRLGALILESADPALEGPLDAVEVADHGAQVTLQALGQVRGLLAGGNQLLQVGAHRLGEVTDGVGGPTLLTVQDGGGEDAGHQGVQTHHRAAEAHLGGRLVERHQG